MKKLTYTLGFLLLSSFLSYAKVAKQKSMPKAPLLFVENKGQIIQQFNSEREDIQYKVSVGSNMNIYIGGGAIHYQWAKEGKKMQTYRLDVSLLGVDKNASAIAEGKQDYIENYFLPQCSDGVTANSFTKITYRNIYKNIDWVLYTNGDKLEYDFIVHAGGNPKNIKIKYDGATALVAKNGAVTAATPLGNITEHKPYSYDAATKKEVASAFVLENNVLSFNLASHKGDVVIDPTLSWATYYGGDNDDFLYGVITDTTGNIYAYGYSLSTNLVATSGSFQSALDSNSDAFVVKFNASGARQWATYYGGKGNDNFMAATIDINGNLCLGGYTSSTSNIALPGSYQSLPGPCFFVKFNTSVGNRLAASYLNGHISNMATDFAGSMYIAGSSSSNYGIATAGSHKQFNLTGFDDGFIMKFDASWKRQWGTYYGGKASDFIQDICTDIEGNIYVGGHTGSDSGISTPGSFMDTINKLSSGQAFIAKFNAYGKQIWGTYYGGINENNVFSVTCDGEGNLYAAGNTTSPVSIATPGAFQSVYIANMEGFLVKFNSKGSRLWATYYGNAGDDYCSKVQTNDAGDVYVAGSTTSATGIASANGYKTIFGGNIDAFIAQFNKYGQRLWATYYGGPGIDMSPFSGRRWIDYCAKGKVHLASQTSSASNIATPGSFKDTINGSNDGYLAQFSETDTSVYISKPNNYITLCQGIINFNIDYKVTRDFNSGNTFTVILSDTGGNFSPGVNIGFQNSNTSGTIHCALPLLSMPGNHYRLRITASSPADTSEAYLVNVYPAVNPFVHIAVYPNDTVCKNDTITFYADTTRDGGINPVYQWRKNNINIPGETNATYFTTSLSDHDTICCIMTSSHPCAHAPGVSNCIIMSVSSFLPTAKLVATPSNVVPYGDTIIFSVNLTNGGTNPLYQWKKNGQYIAGATHDTLRFVNGVYGDRISVKVSSSLFCAQPDTVLSDTMTVIYTGGVAGVKPSGSIDLYPNPNKGQFTILGKTKGNEDVNVEVLNAVGQLVYQNTVKAKNGFINERLDLGNKPNGMYMIRVYSGALSENLRFVINK
jgi:hypothetical protein